MTKSEFQQLQFEMENTKDANSLLDKLSKNACYDLTTTKTHQKVTNGKSYSWQPAILFSWKMLDHAGLEHECFNCI